MASEDRSPKLPPPPSIGGGSKAPAAPRISPPALAPSKADARAVGVDTSFIDGLTAGLLDEIPGQTPPPAAPKAAPDEDDDGDGDDLEHLATRAFAAMDENGEIAQPPQRSDADDEISDEDPDEVESDEVESDEVESDEVEAEDAGVVAAAPAFPPPRAATEVSDPRPPSAPAAAASSGIPRSWLFAGVGTAIALLIAWRVSGGGEATSSATQDDRVAMLERSGEEPGGGLDGDADREGADGHAGEGGGGHDQAHGSRDADDPEGARTAADEDAEAARADAEANGEDDDETDELGATDEDVETIEVAEASQTESSSSTRSGGSPKPLPANTASTDRAAEDGMSAEELLQASREAYKKGKVRDAYRLANLSNQKKKSDEALELKAKSACRMKNKDLAKSAYKNLPMGEKRRDVRQTCREHDVRLGL